MRALVCAAAIATAAVGGRASADDCKKDEKKDDGPKPLDDDKQRFGKDAKYVFAKQEEVKGVVWKATAEAGLVLTSGNSETTTATAGFRVSRRTKWNKYTIEGNGTYVKTAVRQLVFDTYGDGMIHDATQVGSVDTVTAETLNGKLRYDRFLTRLDSVYGAALASRDVPAGKISVLGGQVGYARHLFADKKHEAVVDAGLDVSRVHLVTGPPLALVSPRVFAGYKGEMTAGTLAEVSGEVLTNLNGVTLPTMKDGGPFQVTRVVMKAAISAKMSKNAAVQTAVEIHYDHRPGPLPFKNLAPGVVVEAAPVDTIMKAQLIYSFF